jgi:arginyl-tRNA synthetase
LDKAYKAEIAQLMSEGKTGGKEVQLLEAQENVLKGKGDEIVISLWKR